MRTAAVAFALLLAAAGCSSGSGHSNATTSPPQTPETPAVVGPTAAGPGKTQTLTVEGYKVALTVFGYRQPIRTQDPPERAGYVYGGLDVRTCVISAPGTDPGGVSTGPWSVSFMDDTTAQPAVADGDSFSVPLFPQDTKSVAAGACVRGWVLFEVVKDKRPHLAFYTPTNTETPAPVLRWTLR